MNPWGETVDRPIAGFPSKPLRANPRLDILFQLILLEEGKARSRVITSARSTLGAEPNEILNNRGQSCVSDFADGEAGNKDRSWEATWEANRNSHLAIFISLTVNSDTFQPATSGTAS